MYTYTRLLLHLTAKKESAHQSRPACSTQSSAKIHSAKIFRAFFTLERNPVHTHSARAVQEQKGEKTTRRDERVRASPLFSLSFFPLFPLLPLSLFHLSRLVFTRPSASSVSREGIKDNNGGGGSDASSFRL